jgi:hypothetical protein
MVRIEKAGGLRFIVYFLYRVPMHRVHLHEVFRFGGRPPDAHGLPVPTPPEVQQFIRSGFGEVILFGEDDIFPKDVISLIRKYDERAMAPDVFVELKQVLSPNDMEGRSVGHFDLRIFAYTSEVVALGSLVECDGMAVKKT